MDFHNSRERDRFWEAYPGSRRARPWPWMNAAAFGRDVAPQGRIVWVLGRSIMWRAPSGTFDLDSCHAWTLSKRDGSVKRF